MTYDRRTAVHRTAVKQKLTPQMFDQVLDLALRAFTGAPSHTDGRFTLPSERWAEHCWPAAEEATQALNLGAADARRLLTKVQKELHADFIVRDSFAQEQRMTDREWCLHYVDHNENIDQWTDEDCKQRRHP